MGTEVKTLKAAYEEIEEEEDEHLYHGRGWCRGLWLESPGLEAVLPPPEENKHVKDAIAAARTAKPRFSKLHSLARARERATSPRPTSRPAWELRGSQGSRSIHGWRMGWSRRPLRGGFRAPRGTQPVLW